MIKKVFKETPKKYPPSKPSGGKAIPARVARMKKYRPKKKLV